MQNTSSNMPVFGVLKRCSHTLDTFEILTTLSPEQQASLRSFRAVRCPQRTLTSVRYTVTTTHRRGCLTAQALEGRRTNTSCLVVAIKDTSLV